MVYTVCDNEGASVSNSYKVIINMFTTNTLHMCVATTNDGKTETTKLRRSNQYLSLPTSSPFIRGSRVSNCIFFYSYNNIIVISSCL